MTETIAVGLMGVVTIAVMIVFAKLCWNMTDKMLTRTTEERARFVRDFQELNTRHLDMVRMVLDRIMPNPNSVVTGGALPLSDEAEEEEIPVDASGIGIGSQPGTEGYFDIKKYRQLREAMMESEVNPDDEHVPPEKR